MKRLFARLLLGCLALVPIVAPAANVGGSNLTITAYFVYSNSGDVIFHFTGASLAGCAAGAWIPAGAVGFKNLYSTLLAAKLNNKLVTLELDNASLWPASGSQYCRVNFIIVA